MFCDEEHRRKGTTDQGHLLLDYLLPGQPETDPGVAIMLPDGSLHIEAAQLETHSSTSVTMKGRSKPPRVGKCLLCIFKMF